MKEIKNLIEYIESNYKNLIQVNKVFNLYKINDSTQARTPISIFPGIRPAKSGLSLFNLSNEETFYNIGPKRKQFFIFISSLYFIEFLLSEEEIKEKENPEFKLFCEENYKDFNLAEFTYYIQNQQQFMSFCSFENTMLLNTVSRTIKTTNAVLDLLNKKISKKSKKQITKFDLFNFMNSEKIKNKEIEEKIIDIYNLLSNLENIPIFNQNLQNIYLVNEKRSKVKELSKVYDKNSKDLEKIEKKIIKLQAKIDLNKEKTQTEKRIALIKRTKKEIEDLEKEKENLNILNNSLFDQLSILKESTYDSEPIYNNLVKFEKEANKTTTQLKKIVDFLIEEILKRKVLNILEEEFKDKDLEEIKKIVQAKAKRKVSNVSIKYSVQNIDMYYNSKTNIILNSIPQRNNINKEDKIIFFLDKELFKKDSLSEETIYNVFINKYLENNIDFFKRLQEIRNTFNLKEERNNILTFKLKKSILKYIDFLNYEFNQFKEILQENYEDTAYKEIKFKNPDSLISISFLKLNLQEDNNFLEFINNKNIENLFQQNIKFKI